MISMTRCPDWECCTSTHTPRGCSFSIARSASSSSPSASIVACAFCGAVRCAACSPSFAALDGARGAARWPRGLCGLTLFAAPSAGAASAFSCGGGGGGEAVLSLDGGAPGARGASRWRGSRLCEAIASCSRKKASSRSPNESLAVATAGFSSGAASEAARAARSSSSSCCLAMICCSVALTLCSTRWHVSRTPGGACGPSGSRKLYRRPAHAA
mmetsp:Transcript_18306/g.43793  ORF Transcript_18306/g.43793 Transcript_18306/m.43793 type:complete len:214 (+) Transcript_18306:2060-2701(+)